MLDMSARCPVDSAHEKLIGTMREMSRRGSKQNCPASIHLYAPRELWERAQRAAGDDRL